MIENLNTLLKTDPNRIITFLDSVRQYLDDACNAELDIQTVVDELKSWVCEFNTGDADSDINSVVYNNICEGYTYSLTDNMSQRLPNGKTQFKSIGNIILDVCGAVLQEIDRVEPCYEGPTDVYLLLSVHTHAQRDLNLVDYETIVYEVEHHSLGTFIINGSYCSYGGTTWDDNVKPVTVKLKSVLDIQEKQYGF